MNEIEKIQWPGWETIRLIGRGSFGAVYEIQRRVFDDVEKAALKVISIPYNRSDIDEMYSDGYDDETITSVLKDHLKSIVAEYSLMRKMSGSANVVSCDDVQYIPHEDGPGWDVFIKMELLTPLSKSLQDKFDDQTVIEVGIGICNALELCKQYGIVHRDIKPQNIFVSPHGDYKLGDFGIAKTIEKTIGGTKIGTYKYMAPEVYNNQPYGSGADIYSLGLVLYWMLNERRLPFFPLPPQTPTAAIDEEARRKRFTGECIPAPAHGSDELRKIILKACAFDPKDRYASATEMKSALMAIRKPSETPPAISEIMNKGVQPDHLESPITAEGDKTVGVWSTHQREQSPTAHASGELSSPTGVTNPSDNAKTIKPVEDIPAVSESPDAKEAATQIRNSGQTPSLRDAPLNEYQPNCDNTNTKRGLIIGTILGAALVLLLCLTLSLHRNDAANNDGSVESPTTKSTTAPTIPILSISQSKIDFNSVGSYADIAANIEGVQWSTDAPNIVSVSNDGRVTALNGGTAKVYAEYGNMVEVCSVRVFTYAATDDEFAEAIRQLQIVEDYEAQYTTFSYAELEVMREEYISAGNIGGGKIKDFDNGWVEYYDQGWYYYITVYYYDNTNTLVYSDEYIVITDGSFNSYYPTFWHWNSDHGQIFTAETNKSRYYCYHNSKGDVFSWIFYEAEYHDVASRTIVTAAHLPAHYQ